MLIASGTEIFGVSLKFEQFLATWRFHCHRQKFNKEAKNHEEIKVGRTQKKKIFDNNDPRKPG